VTVTSSAAELTCGLGGGAPPHVALVGGKAAGVDRLARAGFRTPQGFSVTSVAHRAYRDSTGIATRFQELRARLPDEDARVELAALAHAGPFPEELTAALAEQLDLLRDAAPAGARLAVRSSATDEDAQRASFAGAHESVLGVELELDAVEAAVRTCWASLWSAGAVAYRHHRALGYAAEMAVLVQRLVEASASAVAFTKDPVTGSTREVVVAATDGLGEGIMAGGDDALTFRVDRNTRALIEVDGPRGPWPLSIGDVNRLVDVVLDVEHMYGSPVDVEAAFEEEVWTLVQARPITT